MSRLVHRKARPPLQDFMVLMERRAKEAFGEWIVLFAEWSWFATLTFSADVSEATAERGLKEWLRILARDVARAHIRFAVATGRQPDGRFHHHVLVALPPGIGGLNELARAAWRAVGVMGFPTGSCFVAKYDPERHAAGYMALRHAELDLNVACPRTGACARGPCVVAPTGWRRT